MELNKAIDQYRAYLEENEMTVYKGWFNKRCNLVIESIN